MASLSPLMNELLSQGKSVEITVTGNSMYPMLRHRISRVRLAPAGDLQKGDLPLYRRDNGSFVLHRIIAVDDGKYTCCGDNQWRPEPGIRPDQIVAVVSDFARGSRWTSCSGRVYRLYWMFWVTIRPLRRLVFGGWGRVKRFVRRRIA